MTKDKSHSKEAHDVSYSKEDLERFRKKLEILRAKLTHSVSHLNTDVHQSMSDHVTMNHIADSGSDTYEEEITMESLENEGNLLVRVEAALKRIEDGTYGICLNTEKRIPKARLDVLPFAEYTIEAQEELERNDERN